MKGFLRSLRNSKGFSLVELMVVVAIIGILATIALPRYKQFSAKAKQSEAKGSLSSLHALMESYRAENDTFPTSLTVAGYKDPVNYRYQVGFVGTPGVSTFVGAATAAAGKLGNGCQSDIWQIDQDRKLTNTTTFTCN